MIKAKTINKTNFLFLVSILLISLFVSTSSLASPAGGWDVGQRTLDGSVGYKKRSFSDSDGEVFNPRPGSSPFSISPQSLLAGAVTVGLIAVPLSRYAYSSFQSWWNGKDKDLLENFKDEGSSKNSAAADRDKKVNEPEEEEKRRREKAKKSFLKERGQGGDKKYEGEKSWSLNEEERAGGAVGLVRENTDFNNQHDRFNTHGNFYGVDLSGKVKDLGSRQMPKGINKATITTVGETVHVDQMSDIQAAFGENDSVTLCVRVDSESVVEAIAKVVKEKLKNNRTLKRMPISEAPVMLLVPHKRRHQEFWNTGNP